MGYARSLFYIATFDEMALKTVLTSLLRKWGIMSVELQQAYKSDQAVITTNDEKIYIDNDSNISINNRLLAILDYLCLKRN
ncbi:MAG: recombinase RecT [Spiroplasma phoeniceum]|nr:MAG: recombinase RecT [Spiroplasma phoeniceum]